MYDPFKRHRVKSFHYANDDGLKRTVAWVPFGLESLDGSDEIWMFEGEPDAILAAQMGFPTLVITGGAGTWTDEVLSIVADRRVVLCYDMDGPGINGAKAVRSRLIAAGKDVVHLSFPLSDPSYKDFTDAVMHDSRNAAWFRQLADDMREGASAGGSGKVPTPPMPVKFGGGTPGEPIIVKAHVMGSHTTPVLAPQVVEATCTMNWGDACERCPARRAEGRLTVRVDPESKALMSLCAMPARTQSGELKRLVRVPSRCPIVELTTPAMWQVQHLKLIAPMAERVGGDDIIRAAMFVSPADGRPLPIRANQLYNFIGKIEPDVLTNEWTLVSGEARAAEDDVESFRLDAGLAEAMASMASPPEWTVEAIDAILQDEEDSMARHTTHVYGRRSLLRAIDLVYHSVVQFPFKGRPTTRGWLSLAIVGDTRTGKSETMSAYQRHVGMGRYVMDPANTTYAGLVGGLQQVGKGDKAWVITWGLIPTNDRGLVIVDEISSLDVADIGKMSGMRSSGVAEITKIRGASTPARTRLIMAGNPRGLGRMLSSFGTPIEALMELIGAPEDVARFDLALAVPQGLDKERADRDLGSRPQPMPVELRRALIKFAWSRASDQVVWEDGAQELCTSEGSRLASKYSHRIPLVEPSEQDLKIARTAVASACRTFSVANDDFNTVFVRCCHVQFAVTTLERLFDGELQYRDYSEFMDRQRIDRGEVTKVVVGLQPRAVPATCRALLGLRKVNPNSIGMVLGLDGGEARLFMSKLAQNGAAIFDTENGRNTSMVWTSDFVGLLRDMETNPPEVDGEDLF
jgi:hypothetical protein